jgi:hypothetical protein
MAKKIVKGRKNLVGPAARPQRVYPKVNDKPHHRGGKIPYKKLDRDGKDAWNEVADKTGRE